MGRYVRNPDGESCEFALVVADAFQGKGVGTALMQALFERARAQGIARMHGEVLTENANMLELVRHLGFSVRPHAHDAPLRAVTLELKEVAHAPL